MRKLVIFVLLAALPGISFADPVKDKLDQLEQSIKTMQGDSVQRNEKVASALSTIEQIKQEYISLSGSIEANNHMIVELQGELTRVRSDMSDRMDAMEEKIKLYEGQISKAISKVLPTAANETDAYKKGLDLVQNSDFLTAVSVFKNFIKSYPKGELAQNAQYWIGECYFALKDYPKAIKEFQLLLDKNPNAEKASSALLKQGISFSEMGMTEEAKPFLNKVIKNYSGTDDAVKAKEKLDRLENKMKAPVQQPQQGAATMQGTSAVPVKDATSSIPLAPGLKQQQQQKEKEEMDSASKPEAEKKP